MYQSNIGQGPGLTRWLFAVILHVTSVELQAQPNSTPEQRFWRPDGPVYSLLATNGNLYMGGQFTYVGPVSGSAGIINTTDGSFRRGFPVIGGTVRAAVPDGTGGWFLGGMFTSVGGIRQTNFVHLLADATVDTGWSIAPNNAVETIIITNNTVYVGGSFTRMGTATRNRLAAFSLSTKQLTSWAPVANSTVNTAVIVGETLVAGGTFGSLGGQLRARIGSVDLVTGAATTWDPSANQEVSTLVVDGDLVYVGGTFTSIGTKPRNRIAALSLSTGIATDWNPNALGAVNSLVLSGTTMYVGGAFTSIGGQTRNRLAALDTSVNVSQATDWDPNANGIVNCLRLLGDTLHVGGQFTMVGGQLRRGFASLNATTGEHAPIRVLVSGFVPAGSEDVNVLSADGTKLLIGGNFSSIGGITRSNAAALNIETGEATGWNPSPNATIRCLAGVSDKIFAGGLFTNIGGASRLRLAALNPDTGQATDWVADVRGRSTVNVLSLLVHNNLVYVGGNFTDIANVPRNSLAAVQVLDGTATTWDPNIRSASIATSASVNAMLLDGQTLYIGGDFVNIGSQSQPRSRLGAVSLVTGNATDWDVPVTTPPSGVVNTLARSGDTIFVGGNFTTIGGESRSYLVGVDRNTGSLTAWQPSPSGTAAQVMSLATTINTVYAAGQFTSMGGEFRNRLAGIRVDSSLADLWDPNLGGLARTIFAALDAMYVGGDFTTVGGVQHGYFATFSTAPSVKLTLNQDGTGVLRVRSGDGARLEVQTGPEADGPWSLLWATNQVPGYEILVDDPDAGGHPSRLYRAVLKLSQ